MPPRRRTAIEKAGARQCPWAVAASDFSVAIPSRVISGLLRLLLARRCGFLLARRCGFLLARRCGFLLVGFVLLLHVTSRCRLDALVLAAAGGLGRRSLGSCLAPKPAAPLRPPASGHALRSLEPAIGIGSRPPTNPIVALVLRRGIDHAGDVTAGTENEGRIIEQLGRSVCGAPWHDVIFPRRVNESGYFDQRKIDGLATLDRFARHS